MTVTKITPANSKEFLNVHKEAFIVLIFDGQFTEEQEIVNNSISAIEESNELKNRLVIGLVDVEENNDLTTEFSVLSVPMIVCISKGKIVKKIDTLEPTMLLNILKEELKKNAIMSVEILEPKADSKKQFNDYLKQLVNRAPVMVFMKGEPKVPRCGFSKQLVELLNRHHIKYDSFDILQDDEVRQGLKEYSDWPTYPQIYARGEFVGGLDILKQMEDTNELEAALNV